MNSSFSWCLVLLAVLSTACSGGRQDPLGGDCVTDSQCAEGGLCITGMCVSDAASATGRVAGAPEDVRVTTRGDDERCEDRGSKGVVCTLGESDGLTLVAPAVEGYRFTHWSGAAACTGEDAELALKKVSKNVTCTANYVKRVKVIGEIPGEGGTAIVASSEAPFAVCEQGSCEVDLGSEVVLLAPARDGLRLTGFDGPGCEDRDGYRVTVVPAEDDITCRATYVESLTVRGQTTGLGELANKPEAEVKASSPWEGALCDGPLCAIDGGNTVVLTAPTVEGFRFRGWLGDPACVGSEPELKVENVTSNVTCSADYATRYTVDGVSEGADVEITASSENLFSSCDGKACVVDGGETVTLIAGVVDGYRLAEWTGEGCEPQPGAAVVVRDVARDTTCTARFVEGVSVSGTLVNATGTILANSTSPGADCEPGSCAIDVGGTVKLSAPSIDGRTFLGWSGSPGCTGKELTITLSDVQASKACRATYAARFKVAGTANPSAGGGVTASAAGNNPNNKCTTTGSCEVDEGSTVTLKAAAKTGYRFTGWTGGGPCVALGDSVVMAEVRSSVTCSANFVRRIEVSGTVAPSGAGTVAATQLTLNASC
ncbi:MAG: InlB B-repeat-containing protein, partial [Polyangiales bacterium]